jgi:outer membrane protein OmpA-like peptidoglycan-associated protein
MLVLARSLLRGATLSLCVVACGARTPQLEQPVGETHTNASSTGGARPQGVDTPSATIGVVIAPEVRRTCGIAVAEDSSKAPRFDVASSARLTPRGDDVLKALAACIAAGKLGDEQLTVSGFADPRGSTQYNEQLGLYRATAVRDHLGALGVPSTRLAVESRGDRDAHGRDEATWSLDRRVEIAIAGDR